MADPRPSPKSVPTSAAERVRQVVARMTGRAAITDHLALDADLSLDPADRMELVAAIELACRLDLPPAEAERAISVGDLVALVEAGRAAADRALHEAIEDLAAGATASGMQIDLAAAARVLAEEHRSATLDRAAIETAIAARIARIGVRKMT
jgi:acyl carrier protein